MTLNTRMYVHDEVDVGLLFHRFRELLGAGPQHPYSERESNYGMPGEWTIGNQIGIGLPALVSIDFVPGRMRHADADACTYYCDDDYHHHHPAHWCEVAMDTAYGYSDAKGRGCGDLHACYVAQIGQWLDERGVTWSWTNEFDGQTHGGDDRYARLVDLMTGGSEATAWFRNAVLPAINRHIDKP